MSSTNQYPQSFYCSITHELMKEPVSDPEGNSFERSAIEDWLNRSGCSPLTRTPLTAAQLVPNRALADAIAAATGVTGVAQPPVPPPRSFEESKANEPPASASLSPVHLAATSHKEHEEDNGDSTYIVHVSVNAGEPPQQAVGNDVVCVIDVSGSMSSAAEVPGNDKNESTGLSILDLVKHAVRTIIETLGDRDYLSLISFSNDSKIVLRRTAMSTVGKQAAIRALGTMSPDRATNLWAGLAAGVDLFAGEGAETNLNKSVLLLTDGMPNQSPPRGETTMLRNLKKRAEGGKLPCTISTFGFGYRLDSEMLDELAQIGNGLYSFIPDSGFIGTTFVHAIANMKCRRAGSANLVLESNGAEIVHVIGHNATTEGSVTTVELPNIQFGQTLDVVAYFRCSDWIDWNEHSETEMSRHVTATLSLTGNWSDDSSLRVVSTVPLCASSAVSISTSTSTPNLVESEAEQRALIRRALAHKFRLAAVETIRRVMSSARTWSQSTSGGSGSGNGVRQSQYGRSQSKKSITREAFDNSNMMGPITVLMTEIRECSALGNECSALLEDLDGQVTEAFSRFDWFSKWGVHYLPSLANAHLFQQCNNFKDPGVQQYGGVQFEEERDNADEIFCRLPAPSPSRPPLRSSAGGAARAAAPRAPINMAAYHNASGGCMHGSSLVDMADGTTKRCDQIRQGDLVISPGAKTNGIAEVLCVVRHAIAEGHAPLVEINAVPNSPLLITPWHPVRIGSRWEFPISIAQKHFKEASDTDVSISTLSQRSLDALPAALAHEKKVCDEVFSFVLSQQSGGVCMRIGGVECITLAHGILNDEVASHDFFGTEQVIEELANRCGWDKGYVSLGTAALVRGEGIGRVVAFR